MAVFPQGLSHVDARCNPGERRVLHQLKRCLEDDYIVWHDLAIGPKARQPDFVILSPRWGVLLLEVKNWKRSTLGHADRTVVELHTPRGPVTEAHPLRQARDYALEMVGMMQADPALTHADGDFRGKLLFPYGWGAVLSNLRQSDVARTDFDAVFPPGRTLLRDDLDETVDAAAFQKRLWGLFTVHYPHTLTLPQRDRIRWHLFPELRLQPQAELDFGAAAMPAPRLPDLLEVMDLQQEQVARGLGTGHRVIHGAAGSGKTMILIYRAQYLASTAAPGQPILVLCFNKALADRIDSLLRARGVDERVQVRTFHAWCQDMVRSYQLDVPRQSNGENHTAYCERLASAVERAVAQGRVPGGQYHALLIDEAHDFEDAWLRIAGRMVSPATASLLVLYDDAQTIYRRQRRRKFSFSGVGIEARGRTSILRLNYRNTAEVLLLAVHCAQSVLRAADACTEDDVPLVEPASAGRRGPLPVLLAAAHERDEAELVAERVAAAHAGGLALQDIAVIFRAKYLMRPIEAALGRRGLAMQSMGALAFRRFDWRHDSVKLVTMHSAKGLEFPLVFVCGLQALPMRDETLDEAARLLYVAMTRSTRELVLSGHGRSEMVERVGAAMQALTRQFSAGDGVRALTAP